MSEPLARTLVFSAELCSLCTVVLLPPATAPVPAPLLDEPHPAANTATTATSPATMPTRFIFVPPSCVSNVPAWDTRGDARGIVRLLAIRREASTVRRAGHGAGLGAGHLTRCDGVGAGS